MNKHIGSSFDDFLEEEGFLIEASTEALHRVFAWKMDCSREENKFEG